MNLTLKTAPAVEPLTLSEAKQHLVVEHNEHDAQIAGLIRAAREQAEEYTARAFITQTWELRLDCFTRQIELPRPPLQSVTSIAYTDTDGNPQTVSALNYEVDATGIIGKVRPVSGKSWPDTDDIYSAVTITYVAGYGDSASSVPAPIRHGMLVNLNDMYEQRGAQIIGTIEKDTQAGQRLIGMYRVYTL